MRRALSFIVTAGILSISSAVGALAADLAKPIYAKAPPPVVAPAYSWTGFYVGADAGGAWTNNTATWTPVPVGPFVFPFLSLGLNAISESNSGSSFLGGFHAGYNWQFAPTWVTGLEGDWSWTKVGGAWTQPWTNFGTAVASGPGDQTSMSSSLDWLASMRGRIGYLVLPNLLAYATGGVAWSKIDYAGSTQNANGGFTYTPSTAFSSTETGYVVGGGLEWAMTSHWLLRGEYLYYNFGGQSALISSVNFPGKPSNFAWSDTGVSVGRLGLSYKF